ncbi:hypothetical protein [Aliarcobacter butzleri]|nr:hypothetical protein [Aliarcobacter butzleri]
MSKRVYKIYSKYKGTQQSPVFFYTKEKALNHKTYLQNLGFTKVYIKARN